MSHGLNELDTSRHRPSLVIKAMANRNPATRRMMSGGGEPRYLALLPLEVLAEARRLGVPCPRLEALESTLSLLTNKAVGATYS